ncbi:permease-like cell division protein FtsX [Microtetraspora malaysiensis]|uniref:permease-like cell division protein FtsX n=1 Tax=Microtetraspora malaysiensis TaxID=161358 RepID=UPI000833E9BD|nr:permease-like cell division protein FtsX [Microtetraspora malaysiensis]
MNDLDDLIMSLRPDTDDAYQRRRESDLARTLATPRRRSFSLRLRLAAVAVPVVLVGVVAAVALAPAPSEDRVVMAASLQQVLSAGAEEPVISVFLCFEDDAWPACGGSTGDPGGGGSAITEQEKENVNKTLTTMPGVENVTFEDKAALYDRFRKSFVKSGGKPEVLEQLTVEDMHESFRVTMKPGADWRPVIETAKGMPGVASVFDQRCCVTTR